MEKSYDEIMEIVGKTAEISYENSKSTAAVFKKLEEQERLLGGVAKEVNRMNDTMTNLSDDVEQLKLNEEITTTQADTIRRAAEKRIIEILGNDAVERKKYFRTFIGSLYRDSKRLAGLGSRIECTKKGNYQRVIDFIESWIPNCGCVALREKADENAKARLAAKKLGYIE